MKTIGVLLVFLGIACQTILCAELPNDAIVVKARPKFKTEDHFRDLIVSDGTRSYEIGWAVVFPFRRGVYFYPISLNPRKIYTFTIIQEPFKSVMIPKLKRVEAEGKVIFDAEVCEIHKTQMVRKNVPIEYGLILQDPAEPTEKVERSRFPHRHELSFGGCVISSDSPTTSKVYVCAKCKDAYQSWKSKNQKSKK